MEYDKVNILLVIAMLGLIIIECLLIWKGMDSEYIIIICSGIFYLAGVTTPNFFEGYLKK